MDIVRTPVTGFVEYELHGPNAGKNIILYGVRFINGKALVPREMHDATGHVLQSEYSAKPTHPVEALKAKDDLAALADESTSVKTKQELIDAMEAKATSASATVEPIAPAPPKAKSKKR